MSGEIDERDRQTVRRTIQRISVWAESKKVPEDNSVLIKDAAMGFNMACDFLAHELRKIGGMENEEILKL